MSPIVCVCPFAKAALPQKESRLNFVQATKCKQCTAYPFQDAPRGHRDVGSQSDGLVQYVIIHLRIVTTVKWGLLVKVRNKDKLIAPHC